MTFIPAIIPLKPNRVWRTYLGGKLLDEREGKALPVDSHFPEDWIGSATRAVNQGRESYVEEGVSKIAINGKEYLFTDLLNDHPIEILGPEHFAKYGARTQFLLKFLDSSIRLHIQAHPTMEFSRKHLNSNQGKTEAYVILKVREEVGKPYIFLGFQNLIDKKDFKEAVEKQDIDTITSCFEQIQVRPGDVFIVPGGMPHAIGPGVLMVEIMEPTDFVARLEFERGGYLLPEASRFMGRSIDFGMDMIYFEQKSEAVIKQDHFCRPRIYSRQEDGTETILIDEQQTSCFRIHKLKLNGKYIKESSSFYIAIITKGNGSIIAEDMEIQVGEGDRILIPYKTRAVHFIGSLESLLAFPPN